MSGTKKNKEKNRLLYDHRFLRPLASNGMVGDCSNWVSVLCLNTSISSLLKYDGRLTRNKHCTRHNQYNTYHGKHVEGLFIEND